MTSFSVPPVLYLGGLLLLCFLHRAIAEDVAFYKSRPDISPLILNIEQTIPEKLAPGYIFIAPYEAANSGPYIFDNNGELVWSGWGVSGPGNAHGIHVCKYKGADHLCFFQGDQQKGYCRGHGVILDNSYRIVRSVQPGGGMAASDMHEFRPLDDGRSALMTVYQQRQFDMSPWNVRTGMGWIMESVFQEVDIETSKVLFEWRSLDHVDPSLSYTWPSHTDTSGTGLHALEPWDYFHINSVDKNQDGDYLISSRHTSAIYKISGRDGSIMWQLHGAKPTFRNINFSFSQQHDARWLFENTTHSVISFYNNGYNGFNQTHPISSGMIVLIDHVEKTATQIREYAPAVSDLVSSSQGNLQVLPNQNVFAGWGNNPFVSEHDPDGNLVLWARFAEDVVMNYRAQKFEWEGNPTDSPALWSYSRAGTPVSPLQFYVSWNGATQVKTWRFFGAQNATGPWELLAEAPKTGFETAFIHPAYFPWTRAGAIGADGQELGMSEVKYTFVPSSALREFCQMDTCLDTFAYGSPGEEGAEPHIPTAGVKTVPWIEAKYEEGIWSYPSGFPHIHSESNSSLSSDPESVKEEGGPPESS
ncbi:Arylsulfotransferase family protein [Penicillium ucsense]|uniref:Arylsulfotransferase family protein n=1 Tax=Penicillium ucsense TaxID=2839758 RepID=A0A8J8W847_9EURO|nr:Arylsulfotransferase family protein [Penicillium ucsense]